MAPKRNRKQYRAAGVSCLPSIWGEKAAADETFISSAPDRLRKPACVSSRRRGGCYAAPDATDIRVRGIDAAMEPGVQRPWPEPSDALAVAAAAVQTLEDLAALLRDLRRRHARSRRDSSLTYRELAARTGWSRTAIAEYFTARTLPPTDRFDALLEVLDATAAERRALATARDRIEEACPPRRRAPCWASLTTPT
jgi:transcriptional regulator with XRE-family HTH domain